MNIKIIPRISIFQSERCNSINDQHESQEVSTPLLPKRFGKKPKGNLQERRSAFNEMQVYHENQHQIGAEGLNEASFSNELTITTDHKAQPIDVSSPLGSSSCGEESPLSSKFRRCRTSPAAYARSEFNEDFYRRIEDFLDHEKLHIASPDDGRRRTFNNLRVSTTKVVSSDIGSAGLKSGCDSPGLISPSIHASSLFQRRSSSRDNSVDGPHSQKKTLTKSPFYLLSNKTKQAPKREIEETSSRGSPRKSNNHSPSSKKTSPTKRSFALCTLTTKLQELAIKRDDTEASSATSLKDEDSPLSKNYFAKTLGLCE